LRTSVSLEVEAELLELVAVEELEQLCSRDAEDADPPRQLQCHLVAWQAFETGADFAQGSLVREEELRTPARAHQVEDHKVVLHCYHEAARAPAVRPIRALLEAGEVLLQGN